jgi:sodium-dependent dicarboxylate transporter 2/3/5
VAGLGPIQGRERRLAGLMLATIAAWIFLPGLSDRLLGFRIEIGVIALVGGVLVFVLRIASWKDVQDYVNWGVIVMYGGAVALGAAVGDTHAMDPLAAWIVKVFGTNQWMMVIVVATVAVLLTETISNAAVVSLMLPVVFGMSHELGIPPLAMMYLVVVPAGLAYCLPMSSPPNAIAFSSGYYGIGEVVRRGIWLNLLSLIVFLLSVWLYWPLVGLKL